jgi:hypothetical protein
MTKWIGAVAALVVVTAGCGGGGNGGGDNSSPAAAQGTSVEAQLGFSQAATPAAQIKVENSIAACMKAEGFEYTPVDAAARQAALTGGKYLTGEEFDKQYGYGIATLYGKGSPQSDPNAEIRASLGPADRRAYDRTLSGGRPEQTFFRAADTGDYTQLGGCTKKAADELFGGSELLTTLQRKLDELDEAVLQDQRVVRGYEEWRRCVRDKTGQTFEDSEDIELDIQKRLAVLVGPLPAGESAPGEFANLTAPAGLDRAALEKLRRLELKLADADVSCEEEHIAPVEEKVLAEKEGTFREQNADLLRKVKPLGS